MKKLFSSLILAGGILALAPVAEVLAQARGGNPGLTIFSGVERENILDYRLDFRGRRGRWDRYRLRVPGDKLPQGAAEFRISYPDYYNGRFDTDEIEVRIDGESQPLKDVVWDEEGHFIAIDLEEPLEPEQKVELVFSNVRNPRQGGTFYFNGQVKPAEGVAIRQHLGTWIIDIN
ncbi:DUF2808 domain-containing protein [Euhalothece natronophila Z-M001]|uniref:DUF2808 domain-containing protein n=2 Tax=Euhalothece TaxID=65097 RepID=A0A5B8NR62_9CHRO|nr:DUF2808 domain-containing protein [Euhalothece natronophila Z-M001]